MFIDGEDRNLQYGHDEELHRAGFTQDSPKGDQDCSCAKVCIDYPAESKGHKITGVELLKCFRLKQQVTSFVHAFLGCRK